MKKDMKALAISLAIGLSVGLIACFMGRASSAPEKTIALKESFFDRIGTEEIVKLQIETDLSNLIENRDENILQTGQLEVASAMGAAKTYPIEIRLRGNTRRELCSFPPLKLYFDEGQLKEEGMETIDKYKLVTHCLDDSELVLKEFMVYQLYNQLTEYSFRARLVELTYIDRGGGLETFQQYAILLENYGEMAGRLGAEKMPDELPKNTRIPNEDYQRLVLFQYMIGNTDWNLFKQHNIKWLQKGHAAIPVPYDFDFSGLVNAPYATPHPSLPIDSVRERYLQWRGGDAKELGDMMEEIRLKKETMMRICKRFDALSPEEKQDMMAYINDFFNSDNQANNSISLEEIMATHAGNYDI